MKNIKKLIKKNIARACIKVKDFTIISNNCWGSHIYQVADIPYQTPFVGVFLTPECYIKLISRLRWHLLQNLIFVKNSRYAYINQMRLKQLNFYPIGLLGGEIEIHFLHYSSENEALDKWSRRVKRVSNDDSRLFFKFCDRDGCSLEQIRAFDRASFANKVFFASKKYDGIKSSVFIPNCTEGQVPNGLHLSSISHRFFDAARWIRCGNGKTRLFLPSIL